MAEQNGKRENGVGTKTPTKFLMVALEALSGDLAWQLTKEGHSVKMYIESPQEKDVYNGFLDKVKDWRQHVDWADVIIFDDVDFGPMADELRKTGKPVVGGSVYTDKLENDREFAQNEMKKVGMLTLPHWQFENYEEALTFIAANPSRYVFKPSGTSPSDLKSLLFLGKEEDGKDIYQIIKSNKKYLRSKIRQFQLQRFVSGVEVAVGAFFNGVDFIYPVNINFEHKRLFPGDIGPLTGEMGTLMFWAHATNPIFRATLLKMKQNLVASGYVGYIDINCIANARGIYPLEFTCRFGYPTISIQMEGVLNGWGEFFRAIARHEEYELKTKKGFQVGVVCAVPPFPYDDKAATDIYRDLSITFKKPSRDGMHLGDLKLVENDWQIAGYTGYALVVTGAGPTVRDARRQAYSRIDNIMLQGMFYRTDIGESWNEASDKLQTWGYLH